ncbi:MAG: low molecular weight phosphotyrosine protein phosphatase [Zetaproteobacteria bacterium]|nr:low molecular weight phosphotyrosine protein phosphatase [Zetaproteobacteria bacterium]
MFNRILVVCVGNICRSPVAERFLMLRAPENSGVQISSAGIGALVDHEADPMMQRLMQERGIDISDHRARQLTHEMSLNAELILVMEQRHLDDIHAATPSVRGRVHLLGKWDDLEIPDPYKKSEERFQEALRLIEMGVDRWAAKLWRR